LYGAETWTLWIVYQKYLESYENVVLLKDGDKLDRSCEMNKYYKESKWTGISHK